jgi:hypothetical protein
MPIQAIAGLASAGTQYALGTKEMKKQGKLDLLSFEEQQKLLKEQTSAQTKQDTLAQASQLALQIQGQKQRERNIALGIVGVIIVVSIGGLIYYYKKRK